MVKELNLRRNKIGNKGATALASFITNYDNTLQDVDLNRNWIEEAGAQKLIDAIHRTIRIEKFEIEKICIFQGGWARGSGNPIS